jgi:hypothetical protein
MSVYRPRFVEPPDPTTILWAMVVLCSVLTIFAWVKG